MNVCASKESFDMDLTLPLSVPRLWHQRMAKQTLCNCLSPEQLDPQQKSVLASHRDESRQQVQTLARRLPAGVQGGQEPHHAGDGCGGTGSWYGTGARRHPPCTLSQKRIKITRYVQSLFYAHICSRVKVVDRLACLLACLQVMAVFAPAMPLCQACLNACLPPCLPAPVRLPAQAQAATAAACQTNCWFLILAQRCCDTHMMRGRH